MKNHVLKSLVALLLCFALILPLVPVVSFAVALNNFDVNSDYAGLKLSVIGDSISTYYGVSNNATYNPLYLSTTEATFGTYYGNTSHGDYSEMSHITRTDTWWQQVIDTLGMELLVNNSWSGSYVLKDTAQSNTTEYGAAAYKARSVNLHNGSKMPDIIGVFLGTNDVAHYDTTNVGTKADVDTAAERSALYTSINNYATPTSSVAAYYIMISRMVAKYPDAEIYCMMPTITKGTLSTARRNALNNFNGGVKYLVDYFAGQGKKVYLVDLDTYSGLTENVTVRNYYHCNNVHPDEAGMDWITACLISEIMEHSTKGKGTSTLHPVTYNLTNAFSAEGLPRYIADGKSLNLSMLPYEDYYDIGLTVTMDGKDVTSAAINGENIAIGKVTGPVVITATGDTVANYSWFASTGGWLSESGSGLSCNIPTLSSGSYSATTGSDGVVDGTFSSTQYTLEDTVVLKQDKPWVIEFEADGVGTTGFASGTFILSNTSDAKVSGNTYLYLDQTSVNMGYSNGSDYYHAGVKWSDIATAIGSTAGALVRNDSHIYRIVNKPSGSTNDLYLYVDGINVGTMDQFARNSAVNTDMDFYFNYQGTLSFPLRSCTISYLKVWENGIPTDDKTAYNSYRWELTDSQDDFVNVDGENLEENSLTHLSGSLADGQFTNGVYATDKTVELRHDKLWSIEWYMDSAGDRGAMILSSTRDSGTKNNVYLFRSVYVGIGFKEGSKYKNYVALLEANGIDRSQPHVYRVANRIHADGSNMAYLFVDGEEVGPLNQYYLGGTNQNTTSDWISGKDFEFNYVGTLGHPVNEIGLSYLQVNEDCTHNYDSWTITTQPTCTQTGIKTATCTDCGKSTEEIVPVAEHSYENGYCSVCGEEDPDYVAYYLFGYINGADYGCQDDDENMGEYKFVDGKLTATFETDSYIAIKTSKNANWYMTHSYVTDKTATFYNTATGTTEKMFVPGGAELTFTLTVNDDDSLTLSYVISNCPHNWGEGSVTTAPTCTESGVKTYTCSICAETKTETIAASGHDYTGVVTAPTCTEGGYTTYTCGNCSHSYQGDTVDANGHSYENGKCTVCGADDPAHIYYLFGYINGADYACEGDCENMGEYKFADGKLTATFTQDSYVAVKTEGNGAWYMAQNYVETTSATLYNTKTGTTEKMFVPGNVEITFTLTENEDGSVTLSYTTPVAEVIKPTLTPKYPSLSFEGEIFYNVYFTVSDITDVTELGLATFDTAMADGTVDNATAVIPGYEYTASSNQYKVRSEGIPAKKLGDDLYFRVYAKLTDGSYVYSGMYNYSAVAYAKDRLANSKNADMKALCVAMLNYGAAAQVNFNYKTDSLMNSFLTAEQKALVKDYDSSMVKALGSVDSAKAANFVYTSAGFSNRYPSVSFEGAFAISYYFTASKAPANGMKLYYWDSNTYATVDKLTTENATGVIDMDLNATTIYKGTVEGIAAKEIDSTIYVAGVYEADGVTYCTGVLPYSLGAYCIDRIANGSANMQAFAAATAVYGYYAKVYFGIA